MSQNTLDAYAGEDYCYLTTTGRRTGTPHEIEIWFGQHGSQLYLLSGNGQRADWVRNLRAQPQVRVRLGGQRFAAQARIVSEPDELALARQLLAAKYYHWETGEPLDEWAATALPVALDVELA